MEYKRLGDLATYVNGYAFKPADRSETGLPIIRIQDLTGNGYDLGFYDGEYPKKVEINNVKFGHPMWIFRIALSGQQNTIIGGLEIAEILDINEVKNRLNFAKEKFNES